MQTCKSLCPKDFTLETLDNELELMALIRALAEEYNHFTSSLLLLKDLKKEQVHAALRVEEENELHHAASSHSAMAAKFKQPPPPSSSHSSSSTSCIFCSGSHPTEKCYALDRARRRSRKQKHKAHQAKADAEQDDLPASEKAHFGGQASLCSDSDHLITDADHDWCADSGASAHMTCHRHWFVDYKVHKVPIELADNTVVHSAGIGSVMFHPVVDGKQYTPLLFTNVLHVPQIHNNLMSLLLEVVAFCAPSLVLFSVFSWRQVAE
jgi:hypothetical protein